MQHASCATAVPSYTSTPRTMMVNSWSFGRGPWRSDRLLGYGQPSRGSQGRRVMHDRPQRPTQRAPSRKERDRHPLRCPPPSASIGEISQPTHLATFPRRTVHSFPHPAPTMRLHLCRAAAQVAITDRAPPLRCRLPMAVVARLAPIPQVSALLGTWRHSRRQCGAAGASRDATLPQPL